MEMPERSIFATSPLSPSFTIIPTPRVDVSTLSPVLLSDIQGWQSWLYKHKQAAFACPINKPADGTHLCTMCLVYLVGGVYCISSFL